MGTHWNGLSDTLLMSTDNIYVFVKIRKLTILFGRKYTSSGVMV